MTIVVSFENFSKFPINIWKSSNSWGWDNLAIVIVRGKSSHYYRKLLNPMFTRNGPTTQMIAVKGRFDEKICLTDPSWVSSNPPLNELLDSDVIVATYSVPISSEGEMLSTWSGVACGSVASTARSEPSSRHNEANASVRDRQKNEPGQRSELSDKLKALVPLVRMFGNEFDRSNHNGYFRNHEENSTYMCVLPASFMNLAKSVAKANLKDDEIVNLFGEDQDILGFPGIWYYLEHADRLQIKEQRVDRGFIYYVSDKT